MTLTHTVPCKRPSEIWKQREKDKKYQHLLPPKSEPPREKKKKKRRKKKKVTMLPDDRVNHWSIDDGVDGSVGINIDPSGVFQS